MKHGASCIPKYSERVLEPATTRFAKSVSGAAGCAVLAGWRDTGVGVVY